MVYEWGYSKFPVDVEEAAREIKRVASTLPDKAVLASELVEASRPKDALLHDVIFAESDKEAAEKHRVRIAQKIVHSVVEIQDDGTKIPAFQHIDFTKNDHRVQGYQEIKVVAHDPPALASAIGQLFSSLDAVQRRAEGLELTEFHPVWEAVDSVRAVLAED